MFDLGVQQLRIARRAALAAGVQEAEIGKVLRAAATEIRQLTKAKTEGAEEEVMREPRQPTRVRRSEPRGEPW